MINGYANVLGNTGYSIHARNFFRALNRLTEVCLIPKHVQAFGAADQDLNVLISRLAHVDLHALAINIDYPEEMFRFGGRKRVGYTVFETERLSSLAVHQFNQLDQAWVPTHWGRSVMMENGIREELIRVVPEGINPDIYKLGLEPFPQIEKLGGMRFLAVGKWEERKGVEQILQAFDQAFSPSDPVFLVTHFTNQVYALQDVRVKDEIDRLKLRNRGKIVVIESMLDNEEQMARLYNSCHAFVSASKAEGWGLPIVEAMACGLPTIAPFYSGPTEYLTPQNSFPLEVTEKEDIYCPKFFPKKGAQGQWAKINVDRLAALMQEIFRNPDEAKKKGLLASQEARTRWTWDEAAKKALGYLKELDPTI